MIPLQENTNKQKSCISCWRPVFYMGSCLQFILNFTNYVMLNFDLKYIMLYKMKSDKTFRKNAVCLLFVNKCTEQNVLKYFIQSVSISFFFFFSRRTRFHHINTARTNQLHLHLTEMHPVWPVRRID